MLGLKETHYLVLPDEVADRIRAQAEAIAKAREALEQTAQACVAANHALLQALTIVDPDRTPEISSLPGRRQMVLAAVKVAINQTHEAHNIALAAIGAAP